MDKIGVVELMKSMIEDEPDDAKLECVIVMLTDTAYTNDRKCLIVSSSYNSHGLTGYLLQLGVHRVAGETARELRSILQDKS